MTIARFGRVTPVQLFMLNLAGCDPSGRRPQVVKDSPLQRKRMRGGRRALSQRARHDFGYDLAAWHSYLERDAEYRHPYARCTVFAAIKRAIDDPARQKLAALLTEEEGVVAEPVPVLRPRATEQREPLDVLKLSPRLREALRAEGVKTLGSLVKFSEQDLLELPGIGRMTVRDMITQLRDRGLALSWCGRGGISSALDRLLGRTSGPSPRGPRLAPRKKSG